MDGDVVPVVRVVTVFKRCYQRKELETGTGLALALHGVVELVGAWLWPPDQSLATSPFFGSMTANAATTMLEARRDVGDSHWPRVRWQGGHLVGINLEPA